jgi:hypothetical protein
MVLNQCKYVGTERSLKFNFGLHFLEVNLEFENKFKIMCIRVYYRNV